MFPSAYLGLTNDTLYSTSGAFMLCFIVKLEVTLIAFLEQPHIILLL